MRPQLSHSGTGPGRAYDQGMLSSTGLAFHWTLPTGGDSRYLVAGGAGVGGVHARGDRQATLGYLGQITRAVEQLGFTGIVVPAEAGSEDAWVSASMLASTTGRLRFLVSV